MTELSLRDTEAGRAADVVLLYWLDKNFDRLSTGLDFFFQTIALHALYLGLEDM